MVLRTLFACLSLGFLGCATGLILPEQRTLDLRRPEQIAHAPIPEIPEPATVVNLHADEHERKLTLDEAIRISLENSKTIRILAGVTATTSGQTIYDAAITNTTIDQERARFDPKLDGSSTFTKNETPFASFAPFTPIGTTINGVTTDGYHLNTTLSQTNLLGGTAKIGFTDDATRTHPGVFPLNPQNQNALLIGYTQPLLKGAGVDYNKSPIMIARFNTERSYYQFRDSMQDNVRGVIEAYWALVFARTDVWAKQQQVNQGEVAFERADARKRQGLGSAADVAQAALAQANFKANLIGATANQLQREGALRNIIGLPPEDETRLVPVSAPSMDRLDIDWTELLHIASEHRPDLIELELIIEADQQLLLQARNQSLPTVDATTQYQWNGLEGRTPTGAHIGTVGNQYTDWTLGVNFSVPLGLRKERAVLRQQELILARDHANLDQALHAAQHTLATNTRSLAQFHEQYLSFKEARIAARANLEQQAADFRSGRAIFLNVLSAITDWGNAVSAEAQSLTQYNTELANVERQSGTILETHDIHFFEERYASKGPFIHPRYYPQSTPPGPNADRYPKLNEPAENTFDLKSPAPSDSTPPSLPRPPTAGPPAIAPLPVKFDGPPKVDDTIAVLPAVTIRR